MVWHLAFWQGVGRSIRWRFWVLITGGGAFLFSTMIPQVYERDEIDFSKNNQQSLDWDDIIQWNEVWNTNANNNG